MEATTDRNKTGIINRIYGGISMSWPVVILYAVCTAVLTAVFLIFPVFKDTSFERMGVHLEAWIFFAVIIMANCKTPLESALKTFVFFLVSQPLIYLIQVPFSFLGWGLFGYYRYWFIVTLLTFPMAFVGWYITKKSWLSVLIFAPVLVFLGVTAYSAGSSCMQDFPHLLVTAVFCILQIILYVLAFLPDLWKKAVGIAVPVIAVIVVALAVPQVDLTTIEPLPGDPSFSEEATITVEDASVANVQLHAPEEGIVYIPAQKHGSTDVVVTDGGNEFRYNVEIYRDHGVDRTRITFEGREQETEAE